MVFFVSGAGMLPVVPLPPHPLPHVCDLQWTSEGKGLNAHTKHILTAHHHEIFIWAAFAGVIGSRDECLAQDLHTFVLSSFMWEVFSFYWTTLSNKSASSTQVWSIETPGFQCRSFGMAPFPALLPELFTFVMKRELSWKAKPLSYWSVFVPTLTDDHD